MNRELFLAILSMDSYNRGYGTGIKDLPDTGAIGRAKIIAFPDSIKTGWEATGFYALAYDVSGAGIEGLTGTVIAYRGTDNFVPFTAGTDFWSYGIGIGQPFALTGGLTEQARLTIEFYRAVAGEGADPFAVNITTTGHSLGGGLAGFVGLFVNKTSNDNQRTAHRRAA
jgi:hypothetical protein